MFTAKLYEFPRDKIVRQAPAVQHRHDMYTCKCEGCTETRELLSSIGYVPLSEAVHK